MKARTKLLSILLSIIVTIGLTPIPAFATSLTASSLSLSAQSTAHTRDEAVAWVNDQVNLHGPGNPFGDGQCVWLTFYYYQFLGQTGPTCYYASDYANGSAQYVPSGWSYQSSPQPGDIAVWSGAPGHVAVVTEIRGSQMVCVEQNYANKLYCTPNLHSIDAATYIRPDWPSPDTQAPSISNAEVYNVTSAGYWVRCKVTDNVGVTRVSFPTWIEGQGVDDVFWCDNVGWEGDTVYFCISIGDHGNRTDVNYITHVYAYDAAGNSSHIALNPVLVASYGSEMSSGYGRVIPDGDYAIVLTSTLNSDKFFYLDINGLDVPARAGTNVAICAGSGDPAKLPSHEIWTVTYKDGFYSIKQKGSNAALDVANASLANNANANVHPSHGGSCQQWAISQNGAGFRIESRCNGFSLDNANAALVVDNNVVVHSDNDSAAQRWSFVPVYRLVSQATISEIQNGVYSGSAIAPKPLITWNSVKLSEGEDYTLNYSNNTNAGTATLTVTGKGGYTGTKSATFKISPASIAGATVSGLSDKTHTGKPITQSPTVKLGGATLKEGTDYIISYKDNVKAGTATLTVTGKGNYTGSKSATFKINAAPSTPSAPSKPAASKASLSKATITGLKAMTYTGKALAQAPTVKLGSKTLKAGTDYAVFYKHNVNAGTATVAVTGKGAYTGSKSATFKIAKAANPMTVKAKPQSVKASEVKKASQSITAKKAFSVSKAKGKVAYKKVSGNKKIAVSSSGEVTVKKGLKKGTYKVKVKVTAKGNANYKTGSKTVTVKVKVK